MAQPFRLLLALFLSIFATQAAADSFQAKVIRVLELEACAARHGERSEGA